MPEFVCDALLRRKKAQQEYFLTRNYLHRGLKKAGASRPTDTPVVLDFYAQRVHPDTFGKWWERDRKLLGLDGWCLHELRHSYLSMLAQQGVHPKVMQELAGHASATITMDIYTHVNMDQKREAADVMEDAFQSIGAEEEFMAKHAEDAPKAAPTRSAMFVRHAAREHQNKPRYKPRNDSYRIHTSSPTAPSSK